MRWLIGLFAGMMVAAAAAMLLSGPDRRPPTAADSGLPLTLEWEELIPADWQPDLLFDQYNLEELKDDDQLAIELLEKLMQVLANAPVVEELDGKLVRLPGFAVPLEVEPGRVAEFLLVPYFGACIHVPPPPANQTVFVKAREPGKSFRLDLFETVWVIGTLRAQRFRSELAEAGYTIYADRVEPYLDGGDVTLK